jgi:hypothetical protein
MHRRREPDLAVVRFEASKYKASQKTEDKAVHLLA